jgi:hypothetical protein
MQNEMAGLRVHCAPDEMVGPPQPAAWTDEMEEALGAPWPAQQCPTSSGEQVVARMSLADLSIAQNALALGALLAAAPTRTPPPRPAPRRPREAGLRRAHEPAALAARAGLLPTNWLLCAAPPLPPARLTAAEVPLAAVVVALHTPRLAERPLSRRATPPRAAPPARVARRPLNWRGHCA